MQEIKMQERIQATIPANNEWHTEQLEEKAAAVGMTKHEFVFMATDMLLHLDTIFLQKIDETAEGMHIPLWLFIQNKLIKSMAREVAEITAGTQATKLLDEFIFDENGIITGEKLFEILKANYVKESSISFENIEHLPLEMKKDIETTIENLDFSVRAYNCLKRGGINTMFELLQHTGEEILRLHGLGRKSFEEIANKLEVYNCYLTEVKNNE